MEQKIFIFYARPYSFEDPNTHVMREGVSVQYLICNDVAQVAKNQDGSIGYAPSKDSLPPAAYNKLTKVPGYYQAEFVLAQASGSTRLKLNDVKAIPEK